MEAPPRGDSLGHGSVGPIRGRWSRISLANRSSVALASAVCVVVVVFGIVMRLRQFLANRSLSQDEGMLALNIVNRSFSGLFRQLDFLQGAPAGFLVLEKVAVNAFGNDESSLRLLPFIAGSVAVALIVFLARETVAPAAVPLAVALFALSSPLIDWTPHAKPYVVDVLLTVAVLWVALRLLHRSDGLWPKLHFAVVGAVAVWFSFASVFVLAGASTVLVGGALVRRSWRLAAELTAASAPWLIGFSLFAFTLLGNLGRLQEFGCVSCPEAVGAVSSSPSQVEKWRGSLGEFRYITGVGHFLERGGTDAGLLIFFVALGFCVLGLRSLVARRPQAGLLLLAPLVFMLVAWALHKYPVLGRTQLFLVPSFVLLAAEGIRYAMAKARRDAVRVLAAACGAIVVLSIAVPSLKHLANPPHVEDLKPALAYLGRRERPGDTLYVYYTAQYQLRYYLECGCSGSAFERAKRTGLVPYRPGPGGKDEFAPALLSVPPRLIVPAYRGRDPAAYLPGLDALRGRRRVWFLISSLETPRTRFLLHELDRRGTRRSSFSLGDGKDKVGAYLYDMTRPSI